MKKIINILLAVSAVVCTSVSLYAQSAKKTVAVFVRNDSNNYKEFLDVNKKNMVTYAKELYLQGKGSLSLWASACGIPSDVFFALLDRELELDIENKYPVHQTSYTMSKEDNKGGRPESTDSTNPSTVSTKSNGGNNQKKPSTK